MVFNTPIFSSLKSYWIAHDPKLAEQLQTLEYFLKKRNESLPAFAKGKSENYVEEVKTFERIYRQCCATESPPESLLADCQYAAIKVTPLIKIATWVRWLDLEKGLAIAIDSENLLSANLIARSLAEECMRGLALKKNYDELQTKPSVNLRWDEIKTIGKNFIDWGIPRLDQLSTEDIQEKSRNIKQNRNNELINKARIQLNDYVHPNYGSHRIVANPFGIVAPRILCESLNVIYERFFDDPWLNVGHTVKSKKPFNIELSSSSKFNHLKEIAYAGSDFESLSPLSLESGLNALCPNKPDNEINEELGREFLSETSVMEKITEIGKRIGVNRAEFYDYLRNRCYPFHSSQIALHWIMLNEQLLSSDAELKRDVDEKVQIKQILQALDIFVRLSLIKKSVLYSNLTLSFAHRLPLTCSILCRGILEYHAIATWISKIAADKTERIYELNDESLLKEIQESLCKSLFGSYSTEEELTLLRSSWINIFDKNPVAIGDVVKYLPKPMVFEYDLLSKTIHGETLKGANLLGEGRHRVIDYCLARNLSIIGMIHDPDYAIAESPLRATLSLSNINRELQSGKDFEQALQSTKMPDEFEHGRDYFGSGTFENPFKFREGLTYHEAFYLFCSIEEIDATQRTLTKGPDGVFLDKVSVKDRDIYFLSSRHSVLLEQP